MAGKLENLRKTLQSGGFPGCEFIVVHDKQDEITGLEISNLTEALNHSNISLIESSYGSPGNARNAGLQSSKGKLVVFWDSDDIGNTESLREVVSSTDWDKNDAVVCNFTYHRNGSFYNVEFKDDNRTNQKILAAWPGIWRWIFKRDSISETFHSYSMGEDILFLAENNEFLNYSFRNENIYTYFIGSSTQATASLSKLKIRDLMDVERRINQNVVKNTISRDFNTGVKVAVNLTLLKHAIKIAKIRHAIYLSTHLFFALEIIYFRRKIEKK